MIVAKQSHPSYLSCSLWQKKLPLLLYLLLFVAKHRTEELAERLLVFSRLADDIRNVRRVRSGRPVPVVKALKTSKDLYNGVEMEEMADRAKTRDAINAGSLVKVMTGADKMVNGLLDLLQFSEQGESIGPNAKRIANEIVRAMGNPKVLDTKGKSYEMRSAPITFVVHVETPAPLQRPHSARRGIHVRRQQDHLHQHLQADGELKGTTTRGFAMGLGGWLQEVLSQG